MITTFTEVTSNTATATIFLPILASLVSLSFSLFVTSSYSKLDKSLLTHKQARWPHLFIAFFQCSWMLTRGAPLMLTMPSFKKSLIVEQFQGNYLKWKWNSEKETNCFTRMSRNLARQTSRDLHSYCFAMVLTAGFYCDSWAHNVGKVRVVKYIRSCLLSHKSRWSKTLPQTKMATKTQRNRLSSKRFWRQLRWFLAKIL